MKESISREKIDFMLICYVASFRLKGEEYDSEN